MSNLVLRNVSRSFGSVAVVNKVNLDIATGELISLLGPSGCGKTTTLRMIAGFLNPTEGEIEVDGRMVSSPDNSLPPEKRNMSMIFQSYAIWPNMTVAENVAFGLEIRNLDKTEIGKRVSHILDVVQLGALRDRYPAELSGGQQQRVSLARSIVVQPSVLLLDEPLSNLDANLREEMRFEIRRLHDEFNITMVYVTHDQAEAMVTSDRIAVMNEGRIEQLAKPFDLYNKPKTRFVAGFIGRSNFLKGKLNGNIVDFGGFSVTRQDLDLKSEATVEINLSLRPQSIELVKETDSGGEGQIRAKAKVIQRAYLGESWDYQVRLNGMDDLIRVTARPHQVFGLGDTVHAIMDVAQMVVVD